MTWLADPEDPRVNKSMSWTCDICKARIREFCKNTIRVGEPLPGRVVHFGRLVKR